MSDILYNDRIDIIEDGLEIILHHLRKWRKFHSEISPRERDYVFYKNEGREIYNNIIKLSDIIDSGNFLIEIKKIFLRRGEWYFGACSSSYDKVVCPIKLYNRRNYNYARDLRTPFILPLIHQLKDAYLESQK